MRLRYLILSLFCLVLLNVSCGTGTDGPGGSTGAGSFTVTAPGTGEPNAEPIWPLTVGSQFRFDTATWFIGRDFDWNGTRIFVMQSTDGTVLGSLIGEYTANEAWLAQTDDGLVLYATSAKEPLAYPMLILPATVRDGMQWQLGGGGVVIAEASITGGQEEDTIFGHRRTWHLTITPTTLDGRAINMKFAEGRGLLGTPSSGEGIPAWPVLSAIVPLEVGAEPAPVALTAMEPLFGGEPVTGPTTPEGTLFGDCAGYGYESIPHSFARPWSTSGAGGHYLSAIENAAGGFDIRLGGFGLYCDDFSVPGVPTWKSSDLVWSLTTDGNDVTPLNTEANLPGYGYEAPAAQDARTSVWTEGRTRLLWTPAWMNGMRQLGIFFRPPPDPFDEGSFEGTFAHSGSGTFLDTDGQALSFAPGNVGTITLPENYPPHQWWYWPQQPTAWTAPSAYMDPLPVGNYPMVIADAEFPSTTGSTDYHVNVGGQLASGRIEQVPSENTFYRFTMSALRDGPLSVDPLTTILHTDNTRESFLFEHHVGLWKLEHTEHGLQRSLIARPQMPEGHRFIGAFPVGDRIIVATQTGDMYIAPDTFDEVAVATAAIYFWRLPLNAAAEPEPFPSHLELNLAADGVDMRVEWSPEAEAPAMTGWTLADVPVRAFSVPVERLVNHQSSIAIERHALLLNRRNVAEVAPELSVPEGIDGPTPPPLPLLYPEQGELGAYRAEGEIPGLGRVLFAGRVPQTDLNAGPGYQEPPVLDSGMDEDYDGHPDPLQTVRDRSGVGRWTVGAWTTPTGSCSTESCTPVSYFVDGSPSTLQTWLVPTTMYEAGVKILTSPPEGGIVYGGNTGSVYHVAIDGTITELAYPPGNETSTWMGGPSINPSVPGSLSRCRTDRDATTHTVSITCATSDGVERTSPTLVEPELQIAGTDLDDVRWGLDAEGGIYVARSAIKYWLCDEVHGCSTTGAARSEYRAERLDLERMTFRSQTEDVSYHRTQDGDLFAIRTFYAGAGAAWRLFRVTDHGFVLINGGFDPVPGGVAPAMDSDDTFLKVMLADGWLRIPLDEALATTSTCDYNAYGSSAGCVCEPGYSGDGTTCTPVLGTLRNPAQSCTQWVAAGQPELGTHNPVVDPDGDGPSFSYVPICVREGDLVLEWPYVANESGTYVKLNRDTFEPLECATSFPASGSPEYYSNRFVGAFTYRTELTGAFRIDFNVSHAVRLAGLVLDSEDGFDPLTSAYTSIDPVCSGETEPRLHYMAIVGDSSYPEGERAYRVRYGTDDGNVEMAMSPTFQAEALSGIPLVFIRDGAGIVTVHAGSSSFTYPGTHTGTLRVAGYGRNGLDTDTSFAEVGITRIELPLP